MMSKVANVLNAVLSGYLFLVGAFALFMSNVPFQVYGAPLGFVGLVITGALLGITGHTLYHVFKRQEQDALIRLVFGVIYALAAMGLFIVRVGIDRDLYAPIFTSPGQVTLLIAVTLVLAVVNIVGNEMLSLRDLFAKPAPDESDSDLKRMRERFARYDERLPS